MILFLIKSSLTSFIILYFYYLVTFICKPFYLGPSWLIHKAGISEGKFSYWVNLILTLILMSIPNIIVCLTSAIIYSSLAKFHNSIVGAWVPWIYYIMGYFYSFTPTNMFERKEIAGIMRNTKLLASEKAKQIKSANKIKNICFLLSVSLYLLFCLQPNILSPLEPYLFYLNSLWYT